MKKDYKNVVNQKGITLISLVITIIVMLILVGVTVNVAMNGGLFERTRIAKNKTNTEVKREELISALVGAINEDGLLMLESTITELNKIGATTTSTEFPLTVIYKDEQFIVTLNGEITMSENVEEPEWWPVRAENDNDWLYEIIEGNDIRLTQYVGTNFNNITIPNVLTDNGVTYTVKEIGFIENAYCFTGKLTIANGVIILDSFSLFNFSPNECIVNEIELQRNIIFEGDIFMTFYGLPYLAKITIGDNITLPDYVFGGCHHDIDILTVGDNVSIEEKTFQRFANEEYPNTSVKKLVAGDDLTLEQHALSNELDGNPKLTDITIGNNAKIGQYSLIGCNFENANESKTIIIGDNAEIDAYGLNCWNGDINITIGDNAILSGDAIMYGSDKSNECTIKIGKKAKLNDWSLFIECITDSDYLDVSAEKLNIEIGGEATLGYYAIYNSMDNIKGNVTLLGEPISEGERWFSDCTVIRDY